MNLHKLILLILLSGVIRLASAAAADNESFGHHGFYFGAGGTYAFHLFQNKIQNVTSQPVDLTQSYGANARIGYRLLSWFSTELEYE
jgi:opacity protein-like surface antigen